MYANIMNTSPDTSARNVRVAPTKGGDAGIEKARAVSERGGGEEERAGRGKQAREVVFCWQNVLPFRVVEYTPIAVVLGFCRCCSGCRLSTLRLKTEAPSGVRADPRHGTWTNNLS